MIAAPGHQAQIDARPDDTVHFGDDLALVFLALPNDRLAFADRQPKRIGGVAKGGQTGESAQLQAARIDHRGRFIVARRG